MEKSQFVKIAPLYYALAVGTAVRHTDASTRQSIVETFSEKFSNGGFSSYIQYDLLFEKGIELAAKLGLITIVQDPFGPDLLVKSSDYWVAWQNAKATYGNPFENYDLAGDQANKWLNSALDNINTWFEKLELTEADFASLDDEWRPIPLDRSDKLLENATAAIDATIEELRSDNGYAVSHPEEKNYVLEKLRSLRKRITEDSQISWMYVREFALEPLTIIISRYGKAALGLTASAAKQAVYEWLKSKGLSGIDWLFK